MMERASSSVKEATIRGGGAASASARRSKCSVCGALACDGSVVYVCGSHNGGLDEKGGMSVTQMRLRPRTDRNKAERHKGDEEEEEEEP